MSEFLIKNIKVFLLLCFAAGLLVFTSVVFPTAERVTLANAYLENIFERGKQNYEILVTSVNWEELTKNDPPLTDWKSCADPKSSVFFIKDMKPSYRIGDEIILNITVKDYNGRRKTKGGDVVRLLLKDTTNNACSTGYVIDHQDGTYTGVAKLLWAGDVTIEASVGSSRELIKIMYRNRKTDSIKRQFVGTFTRGSDTVTVKCIPVKEIATLYKESCNLTHMNADLPWFCEKQQNYSCENVKFHYINRKINVTAEEKLMPDRIKGHKLSKVISIRVEKDSNGNVAVHFLQNKSHRAFNIFCNELPTKHTWTAQSPVGYVFRGTWYSTQCKSTFAGSVESFETCLHDRKVWFLGDSNMREMFRYYMNVLKLKLETEQWTSKKWHKPAQASNTARTIQTFVGFHALPFYALDKDKTNATHEYIDSIPPKSNDIVIVHFYSHFQPFHPSVVREHIKKTAKSIKALKVRAPEVKVIVRGSHTMLLLNELTFHDDVWGIVYNQILKEEFASMVNDVIYLDMWDLTVATENWDKHPPKSVLDHAVKYLMSLICI